MAKKKKRGKKKSMSEFNLVTAKLHSCYLDKTFLFFITSIASPFQKVLSHSQLRDKRADNINTHRKKIPMGRRAKENLRSVFLRVNFLFTYKEACVFDLTAPVADMTQPSM